MFNIQQLGIIHTPHKKKEDCPIQGTVSNDSSKIELFEEYSDGLETIETFSHLMIFFILDRSGEVILSRPTFLDDENHGVFASRHPCRPNGIGFSIVALKKRENNILHVKGIDILDQSPLIDIKPYVPKFDLIVNASNGWIEGKELRDKPKGRE